MDAKATGYLAWQFAVRRGVAVNYSINSPDLLRNAPWQKTDKQHRLDLLIGTDKEIAAQPAAPATTTTNRPTIWSAGDARLGTLAMGAIFFSESARYAKAGRRVSDLRCSGGLPAHLGWGAGSEEMSNLAKFVDTPEP